MIKQTNLLKYLTVTLKNVFTMEHYMQVKVGENNEDLATSNSALSNLCILTFIPTFK